ncbi:zinc-binding dehydrogenase [Natrinema soli]|uniref:Zinc-binding dehydrogenase n=1 Tax=Natrinema soli TaxID=1930624 RepID=A0ABD5SXB6_9EURY|nr:zinc-binding dehydrogenase [Natrinema soli]
MESTAAVLESPTDGNNLSKATPAAFKTIEIADPTGEEVLVEITAASLCHTDVGITRGQLEELFPLVMGHEGAGRVAAVGEDVESVDPGDQVVLGRITCGRCEFCREGNGQLCSKRTEARRSGTLRTGNIRFSRNGDPVHHCHGVSSFSEYTLVTEEVAIEVDDNLPAEQATLLGCGVFTGAGAVMNTADIEAGSSVVVFGAGGVGLSAVQGARLRSAREVIAVDIVQEKLKIASEVGATHTINSSEEDVVDRVREFTDGGVDYAFEVVGNPHVTEQAIECLTPTGQAVLVGVPPLGKRDISLDLYDMVVSEKGVVGSFNGSYSLPLAIPKLADLAVKEDLQLEPLITDRKPLTQLNEAMHKLETGAGVRQIIEP